MSLLGDCLTANTGSGKTYHLLRFKFEVQLTFYTYWDITLWCWRLKLPVLTVTYCFIYPEWIIISFTSFPIAAAGSREPTR